MANDSNRLSLAQEAIFNLMPSKVLTTEQYHESDVAARAVSWRTSLQLEKPLLQHLTAHPACCHKKPIKGHGIVRTLAAPRVCTNHDQVQCRTVVFPVRSPVCADILAQLYDDAKYIYTRR